jgi:uncharacterized membrane protein YeiH
MLIQLEVIVYILDLIGTSIFAVTGALAAIEKKMDIFGVSVLALITALGGGTMRDLLMNEMPPFYFVQYSYLVIALVTALLVFMGYSLFQRQKKSLVIFDALGLGVFTIVGAQKATQSGFSFPAIIILAMITGIGGGMIRDILRGEIPFVLQKEIYASASILGAIVFYLITKHIPLPMWIAIIVGIVCTVTLRLLSIRFRINLPIRI